VTTGDGRTLLDVDDLDVFLGESHVLHGVSFQVAEGGVTALLGRNGVGKTTTLRGILGLVQRQGSVRYDDAELTALPTYQIVQRRIGYVPEDREVFSELSVAENLKIAERPGDDPRYDLVYELFPRLQERAKQPAGTLSGGEQQMVALGRVLLNDNRLLLIDEPTKGLAPNLVTEVADVLERTSQLTTSLLVEQNLGVVRRIARHAIVLDHGQVVYSGGVAELLDDEQRTRELLGVGTTTTSEPRGEQP
jgi:branched-chain amino acid transport system ATP-binding protein